MKSWPELGALSFDYPRKTLPPNEELARTWHFEFCLPNNTQEKMQLECVETNLCISQGYRLVNLVLYHSFSRVIWLRGRVVEH